LSGSRDFLAPAPLRLPGFQNFRLRLRSLIFNFFGSGSHSSPEPKSKKMFFALSFAHTVFCFLEAFQKWPKVGKWSKIEKMAKSWKNGQKLEKWSKIEKMLVKFCLSIITNFSTFDDFFTFSRIRKPDTKPPSGVGVTPNLRVRIFHNTGKELTDLS